MKYISNKLFVIMFVLFVVGAISDVQAMYLGDDFGFYDERDFADNDTSDTSDGFPVYDPRAFADNDNSDTSDVFPDNVESEIADNNSSEAIISKTKMDEVFDFFFDRLSRVDNPQGADFVKIYNSMPKDLKDELYRIYFKLSKSDQDAIAAKYGYNGPELRAIAEKEIQNSMKRQANAVVKQVSNGANKAINDMKKAFKL